MMKTMKFSRQRESVKKYLHGRTDHPTADAVYHGLKEQFPSISLGTVYRNLNLLAEIGEIRRVTCGDGKDHFDWNVTPHYHLLCRSCGAVEDLMMEPDSSLDVRAQQVTRGRVEGHSISFFGLCENCLQAGEAKKGAELSAANEPLQQG